MTSGLLVLLSLAALGASLALLAARLGAAALADAFAITSALCGLVAFLLVAVYSARRARQLGRAGRP